MAVEEDIQEIKKEIIQSHNLIIKTDNLITNLSAEIRQIQKKQESYERKYWINSVAAYVIIAALCFIGVYIGFEAKVDAVRKGRAQLEESLAAARAEAEELQQKLSVRAQQEKAAEHLLKLKREQRDEEALKVAEQLDVNRLSPVLGRLVSRETEELRRDIGRTALDEGRSLYQRGYLKRAEQELDRAVAVAPPPAILADAHYLRAQLLLKMNKTARAAEDFLAAVAAEPDADWADHALLQAAGSLEASGDVPRALEVYQRLVKAHPDSRWVPQARRRIGRLSPSPEASEPRGDEDGEPETEPKPKPKPKPEPEPEGGAEPAPGDAAGGADATD
jgi:TolA-binding protein